MMLYKENFKLPIKLEKLLVEVGENIRLARLRRKLTVEQVAERADILMSVLHAIEVGDSDISIGCYLKVLRVLGLQDDMRNIAAKDPFGRKLQDIALLNKKSK